MFDLILLAAGVGFFALAVLYAYACESLSEGTIMIFDYILGGLASVVITVYLVYALVRPERF